MKKPLIALIPQVDEEGRWWLNPDYMESVMNAGGIPVMLPLTDREEELEEIEAAQKALEREFGDTCVVFRPADRILDIHAKGISKGKSARELLNRLGRKILVCAGDGENDVTMMDEADYAWCPGDAIICDRYENVCNCADGAVADVIYKKIPEILG